MCSTQKRADYEDFSKGSSETSDTKPFTASKGWLHRCRNRCRSENIKIIRKAAEEAAATFLAEVRKLIKERDHIHITFITVYCYNRPILLLVIVVNLLLCLIYKLNFIIVMYV